MSGNIQNDRHDYGESVIVMQVFEITEVRWYNVAIIEVKETLMIEEEGE